MKLAGFGNFHQSEAVVDALPKGQNSPQHCPYDLYAEQINGSAFTVDRHRNLFSWLYRRLPSVARHDFSPYSDQLLPRLVDALPPNPLRWSAQAQPRKSLDFIDGLQLIACTQHSSALLYFCKKDMQDRYFANLDGEMLIIPSEGELQVATEMGSLQVKPGMILLLPRGIHCQVLTGGGEARGYICENRGAPFQLPNLGVIGANGLANPRHFLYPEADFRKASEHNATLVHKFQHRLWQSDKNPCPLNVVAWQGNYAPCTYDLFLFTVINTVSFDHIDPSIFTVLQSPSAIPGVANLDFVLFPHRWMVAEHSFRPPYYHRNVMSEFMGLVSGQYDAKGDAFMPGGYSIHNAMTAHGPDVESTVKAQKEKLKPVYQAGGLAFMLESKDLWQVHSDAWNSPSRQKDYSQCWQGFEEAKIPNNFA